jgi:DNA invertase Pin-like site-specific DNA recombinase
MSHPEQDGSLALRQPAEAPRSVIGARASSLGRGYSKISDRHTDLMAIVYIRQSSLQQVLQHQESRARQYELADWATHLGWPPERVQVIDDDQGLSGQSATPRAGFQRLLSEVSLGHVGLVLGLEMSRLARSSVDFQNLLEMCGWRGTLIADQEGVYDPRDANDRLLLGLKGTMSEFELVTMRNRLERGKLHKAQRAALFHGAPLGYVKTAADTLELDPDEEVRAVVRLIFDKFAELGSVGALWRYLLQQDIRLGVRPHYGPRRGQLEWRRPRQGSLRQMLHHPLYAGAYVYGRSTHYYDEQRTKMHTRVLPMAQWKVLKQNCLPAYITWAKYLANQERLRQNRMLPDAAGAPRQGSALLAGRVRCGTCGHLLQVDYPRRGRAFYRCRWRRKRGEPQTCYGLTAGPLDQLVAEQILLALEPAAIELHLQAQQEIHQERMRLDQHWQQRLQRAHFETERIERQYQSVEPENRLVARTLEQRWEQALREQRALQEEYDRFRHTQPSQLTKQERALIARLSQDIPALWQAPSTSIVERKEIVRCLLEQVTVWVQPRSEVVTVDMHWQGGMHTSHQLRRPVSELAQLQDSARLLARIRELRHAGVTARQIATHLNEEGFTPPQRRGPFNYDSVRQTLLRLGLSQGKKTDHTLGRHEWWLHDLAAKLGITDGVLTYWLRRGWVRGRQLPLQRFWIVWADAAEVQRLRRLKQRRLAKERNIPQTLLTPRNNDV